jgi:hypothetical protein
VIEATSGGPPQSPGLGSRAAGRYNAPPRRAPEPAVNDDDGTVRRSSTGARGQANRSPYSSARVSTSSKRSCSSPKGSSAPAVTSSQVTGAAA